jgi:hypothetical protein
VIAEHPWQPIDFIAWRSAWIPAPPPESDPAIVYTIGGTGSDGVDILVLDDKMGEENDQHSETAIEKVEILSMPSRVSRVRRMMFLDQQRAHLLLQMFGCVPRSWSKCCEVNDQKTK